MLEEKKTLCFVTTFFYPHLGGVERYNLFMAKKLVEFGFKVIILTTNSDHLKDIEINDGIYIYRIPTFRLLKTRFPIIKYNSSTRKILKEISKTRIDIFIINCRFYLLSVLGLVISKNKKIKSIFIEHGTGHFTVNNKLLDKLGEIYEHFITIIIKKFSPSFYGVSNACNIWLQHFGIKSDGTLYNGIDANYKVQSVNDYRIMNKISNNHLVVTFAGRLIKEKGIYDFLEAIKILNDIDSSIFYFIAGSGEEYDEVKGISDSISNINFLGKIDFDALMKLLIATDIFIHPSKYPEGLPTVILEAGMQKCAVIATPQGGTNEVISDPKYGIIIRQGNISDIVNGILKCRDDNEYMNDISNNIYSRVVGEYNWNILAKNFILKLNL